MFYRGCRLSPTFASEKLLKTFNAMNKNQQKNRMGAVIILLAAACLNGYA